MSHLAFKALLRTSENAVMANWRRIVEEDIRRNVSEDIVILINRGTFRGHEGVRELATASVIMVDPIHHTHGCSRNPGCVAQTIF